jgi:hypothetical protein
MLLAYDGRGRRDTYLPYAAIPLVLCNSTITRVVPLQYNTTLRLALLSRSKPLQNGLRGKKGRKRVIQFRLGRLFERLMTDRWRRTMTEIRDTDYTTYVYSTPDKGENPVALPAAARGGADHQDQDSMDKRPEMIECSRTHNNTYL